MFGIGMAELMVIGIVVLIIVGMNYRTLFSSDRRWILFLVAASIGVLIVGNLGAPAFLTERNLTNILFDSFPIAIMASVMSSIIAQGGIDLSVGSVLGLSGIVMALSFQQGFDPIVTVLLVLGIAASIGMLHVILIDRMGIHSVVITLGTMVMARGISLMLSEGQTILIKHHASNTLRLFTFSLWTFLPIILLLSIVLPYVLSKISGRMASIFPRVSVGGIEYIASSVLAGIVGMFLTLQYRVSTPYLGIGYEVDVISAAILGGTFIGGASSSIIGAFIASFFLASLENLVTLLGISVFSVQTIKGGMLILAACLCYRYRRSDYGSSLPRKKTSSLFRQKREKEGITMSHNQITFLPRTQSNIYSRLEVEKHRVILMLEKALKEVCQQQTPEQANLLTETTHSEAFNFELTHSMPYNSGGVWVQVRLLKYGYKIQRRIGLLITLIGHEFHRFPIEYCLEFSENEEKQRLSGFYEIEEYALKHILQAIIQEKRFSSIKSQISLPRFRTSLQLWRPANKLEGLSVPGATANLLMGAGFFTAIYGIGIIFIIVGVIMQIRVSREKKYVITAGKPLSEPRNLKLIDSWQTIIFDIGSQCQKIREDLLKKLQSVLMQGANLQEENIWHWGLDGKVEKSQIVLTYNRGMAFLHIYPYGNDLYVGWETHINFGQWVENDVASGRDKSTGAIVTLKSISPGWQGVNEYDVQDAISLGEWCHAQLVKTVKLIMKENKLDQEIDFKIIREERSGLTQQEEKKGGKKQGQFFGFTRSE